MEHQRLAAPVQWAARNRAQQWQVPKAQLRLQLMVLLVMLDLVALLSSLIPNNFLWHASHRGDQSVSFLLVAVPIYLAAAFSGGAYSNPALARRSVSVGRSLRALVVAIAIVLFVAFYLKSTTVLSRGVVAIEFAWSAIALTALRLAVGGLARNILNGDPLDIVTICDGVMIDQPDGCTVFLDSLSAFTPVRHDPAARDRFAQLVDGADRVVIACRPERRGLWADVLKGANVQGEIITDELADLAPIGVSRHGNLPTMVVSQGPLGLRGRLMKRGFDLALTLPSIVLLSPLLAAVALAVKMNDGGPILFVQPRLGRNNTTFRIYKFRTMRPDRLDEAGIRSASRDDDRVTPIGRFLRATSIDELPQLFNVLRGQMSVVGPRPHALGSTAEDQLFWEVDSRYWHRHAIKPGLTGLAQVRGYRGATLRRADITNRLQSDLEYLSGWTIWRDVVIVGRTCGVLLHRNAF